MHEENKKIISQFKEYKDWLGTLKGIDKELWIAPISEGKWSISEIISHIMNWDHYLLSKVLPTVKNSEAIEFPEFDAFNKIASDYAKSGITQVNLIKESLNTRDSLVNALLEMPDEMLNKYIITNGVSHCPHTGEPYSLKYIIKEFIDHDHHHTQQVIQYLSRNSLS